ncbi:MAG: phosphogluconate dehydratase [Gammaproteobacteria bacterium]|nr:phosphogluconate dehydratase [Gammaproteobacteria bacterium]
MHPVIEAVTRTIQLRSEESRKAYLLRMQRTREELPPRRKLSCGNLAHGFAACGEPDKQRIRLMQSANLGIVTAYNDMLSAHQPLETYPGYIKQVAREVGSSAQVAGGVPAMCDGVTQGQAGMELSLFSRDLIAMSTAVSLSHNLFDGVLCLGVCDKIVPGMLIGALQFGHLPAGFIPAGPMPSGIPNKEKALVRQRYTQGLATREELLAAESASYHSPGTCTFYGTANSNQVLMEMLGVQLPGASFINPENPLRQALTRETVLRVIAAADPTTAPLPLSAMVTAQSVVNALVALLATGGSTNHTLHMVAMAKAAGILLTWQDFDALSRVTPLLARVYPNGEADVNAFQQAGGMAFLVRELRGAGLLNEDVVTLMGPGLDPMEHAPQLAVDGRLQWVRHTSASMLPDVLAPISAPFDSGSGLHVIHGNLGEGIIKTSAVKAAHRRVTAPCVIFNDQDAMVAALDRGELERDFVAVVRFQGPKANGMPELHQLTPHLGVLQDKGFKVALVTDGRMSGASGKVPAAIHMSPEALDGGALARLRDGDMVALDAEAGTLEVLVDAEEFAARSLAVPALSAEDTMLHSTLGRNLFECFRYATSSAKSGASVF